MKKWLFALAGLVLAVAGVALLWPEGDPADRRTLPGPSDTTAPLPAFEKVEIAAAEPSGLAVTGTVKDASGNPVPDAEVFIAAAAQQSLATVRCGTCQQLLLTCQAQPTVAQVAGLLEEGHGHLEPGAATRSDADGRFRFDRVHGVSFTVWARAPGHGAAVRERAAPGDPFDLYLPPLRAVAGTVTDTEGAPVPGAHVHVVSRRIPEPVLSVTDSRGVFDATGLGEGPFYVLVDAPGFLPQALAQVEAALEPLRVKLRRPRALEVEVRYRGERVDAQVQVTGDHRALTVPAPAGFARLDGLAPEEVTVTATSGNLSAPVQQVHLAGEVSRVTLDLDSAGTVAAVVVDEQGQPVVDPTLSLTRVGQEEPALRRTFRTGEWSVLGPVAVGRYLVTAEAKGYGWAEVPVTVAEGETQVELVMKRGTLIRGRVLDEYGRPAPRISVLVSPTGGIALADDQGFFEAHVPSPGFYELQAHHSDWGGGEARVTAPADGVQLQLEPRAGLRVTVTSGGRRIEGAEVVMWIEREATFRNDRPSGSDGVVLMRGMPPGTYNLIATHPQFIASEKQTVTLRDGELQDVSVELDPGASIRGQVVDELGAPVPGVGVAAIPRGADPALTDADGRFELRPLRPQRVYRLEVVDDTYDQAERVTASAGGDPVTLVVNRRRVYQGRVLSADGEPIKSFRVDEHAVTATDGRFSLPLVAEAGRVFAVVDSPGYQPHMVDAPAEVLDLGDLVLEAEPQLPGVVRDEHGSPVEGAIVSCDVCDVTTRTGPDGRFTVSIPPHMASTVVMATRAGQSGSAEATLRGGGPVEIVLRDAVQLTGRVFDAQGRPQPGVEVEIVHVDRSEPHTVVTMQDGSYSAEVPEGSYRIMLPGQMRPFSGDPITFAWVGGQRMNLDLGAAPGTQSVAVRVTPRAGFALWVVRGVVTQVGNPPLELFKSAWAQMIYQPRSHVVTVHGLAPGRYTFIWSRFHAQSQTPPVFKVVDVPGPTELSME